MTAAKDLNLPLRVVGPSRKRRNKRPHSWKVDWIPNTLTIEAWYKNPLAFWNVCYLPIHKDPLQNAAIYVAFGNEIALRRRFLALMIYDFVVRHSNQKHVTLTICQDAVRSFYGGSCSEETIQLVSPFVRFQGQRGRRYHPLTEKHGNGIIFYIPHDLDSVM